MTDVTARLVKRMDCFTVRTVLGKVIARRREDARLYKLSTTVHKGGVSASYVVVTVFVRDGQHVVGVYPSDANGVASHIGLIYERALTRLSGDAHAAALALCSIEYDGDSITEAVVNEIARSTK
jgi:hypothetical protein